MKRIRLWFINIILTDNERYLVNGAIESRMDYLRKYSHEEKTADFYPIKEDISILSSIKNSIKYNDVK